jgi:hypothetical protein
MSAQATNKKIERRSVTDVAWVFSVICSFNLFFYKKKKIPD